MRLNIWRQRHLRPPRDGLKICCSQWTSSTLFCYSNTDDPNMPRHGLTATTISSLRPLCCSSRTRIASRLREYSSDSSSNHDVAVLGGGITGLACAYYITKIIPRANVTIYEASDRLGGWLASRRVPVKDGTVLFEAGPRTLRPSSNGALAAMLVR